MRQICVRGHAFHILDFIADIRKQREREKERERERDLADEETAWILVVLKNDPEKEAWWKDIRMGEKMSYLENNFLTFSKSK